jgi:hypothetical protein
VREHKFFNVSKSFTALLHALNSNIQSYSLQPTSRMAMYQRFVAVLLVIISLTPLCLGEPKLVSQRAAFYGGFFYPAGQGNCPTHLTNCDPNGSNDGTGAVCCPSNTVCQGQFENNGGWWRYFCCPDCESYLFYAYHNDKL